ncbi:MAG: hypothetical protein Q4A03_02395 [Rothia sp. (in: high G+C Gram-positive bacteria)]|uniref:hypothetical protein n=1 Tax=Rothia sp. (in: high G+C Gram-positive bacteria) TaxID=1885016 RepID=UPI002711037E|nr:hypothetical protein [Rothia sp. (in: high G+C Gram-positive bacteria)]
MTVQPYTADQILAAFSKGLKGTRMKAMAQEIAGLANENADLKQQLARVGHQPTIDEIELANEEAARILAEARAQTFVEATRAWEEGHENWKRAHDQGEFIPSPISTVALEFVSVLAAVGEFHPFERRLDLAGDYGSATLSIGKKEAAEPVAELLGRPEPGDSITRTLDVLLLPARHQKANEPAEKYVFGYADGHLVGGLTMSYSKSLLPFLEAMVALDISVVGRAEVTLSAAKSSGNLQVKSSIGMPDRYAVRDTMPKIYRLAKTLNSIYVKNQLMNPGEEKWADRFGHLSAEMREGLGNTRDWQRELKIMGG